MIDSPGRDGNQMLAIVFDALIIVAGFSLAGFYGVVSATLRNLVDRYRGIAGAFLLESPSCTQPFMIGCQLARCSFTRYAVCTMRDTKHPEHQRPRQPPLPQK